MRQRGDERGNADTWECTSVGLEGDRGPQGRGNQAQFI